MLIIILLLLSACSNGSSSSELIALGKLGNNSSEDLFMLNDRVYIKADDIIESKDLDVKKVGEITKKYIGNKQFSNGMATKLDIGTSVYATTKNNITEFLYIKVRDKFIKYIAETEG